MKKHTRHLVAGLCSAAVAISALSAFTGSTIIFAADNVAFSAADGWMESAYCEWAPVSGADGYNVYVDGKQIDSMLIRQYNGYFRADAVGLKAGSHTLKVVPTKGGSEVSAQAAEKTVTVTAHDRSGFGWVQGSSSGAYNDDGTLKSDAVVLYITEDTKDIVSMDVVTSSKGATTTATGVQAILGAYQKGYETRPLDLRFIGNVTDPATLEDGDLLVKGNGASKRISCGVTVEGIGTDTVFNGFGLRIANASNVEVRNIGFMNCNSGEGDNVGLQQNNDHVWVHNCDMFYGDAGSDADQVKGDGALDTKTSTFITHSYNHFWDNGKCNLQGMKSESPDNYITYHHNWYDHSDSRHPRIRTCSVHIYNNYFDGNAKYGVGVTMAASAFVENNYFRNCPKPMLSSMQGSDIASGTGTFSSEDGGIIKACGNEIVDAKSYVTYAQDSVEFDAYEVSSPKDTVPSSVKTKKGGTSYNNFDTSSVMYSYTADAAKDVPTIVTANAGRVQGGDFKWQFNNATDDASYTVDEALKKALVEYKGSIISIGSGSYVEPSDPPQTTTAPKETTVTTTQTSAKTDDPAPGTTTASPIIPSSGYVHNFTESGMNSSFYTISGNLSSSKGTVEYGGMTLTQCLKMESATSISFNAPEKSTLVLVFVEQDATIKYDGTSVPAMNGIITIDVEAGSHELTKASNCNLFYMNLATDSAPSTVTEPTATTTVTTTTVTTTASSSAETTTTTAKVPETNNRLGDVNCDTSIDVADAVLLSRYIAQDASVSITDQGLLNGDVNHSGAPDSNDVTMMLRYIAHLITSFD